MNGPYTSILVISIFGNSVFEDHTSKLVKFASIFGNFLKKHERLDVVKLDIINTDKIDSLVGFFGINLKPSSSKDPYAIRRTAISVVRLIIENNLKVNNTD